MTAKESLIEDIKCNLFESNFESNDIKRILTVVVASLSKYDIKEGERGLVTYDKGDADLINRYFISKAIEGLTERSLRFYEQTLSSFMKTIRKHLKDITGDDITIFLMKGKMRGWSDTTADNNRRALSSFFTWAHECEYISSNPMKMIKKIRPKIKDEAPLTDSELEMARHAAGSIRNRALIETLYSTGCRVTELAILNRTDVDFNKGEILVYGKGKKYRTVYLSQRAIFALKEYLDSRTDNNEALFVNDYSKWRGGKLRPIQRLKASGIEIVCRNIGKKIGIRLHPHLLRKTVATQALRRGMPIEQIQKMLGHSSISTTTIYAKTMDDDVKASHAKYV